MPTFNVPQGGTSCPSLHPSSSCLAKRQPQADLSPRSAVLPLRCSSGAHSWPRLRCSHPRGCLCGSKASRIVTSGACEQKGLGPLSLSPLDATDLTLLYSFGCSQPITPVTTMTTPHDFHSWLEEGWVPTCHPGRVAKRNTFGWIWLDVGITGKEK